MEVVLLYGCVVTECINRFQNKVKKEIERLTSMNVQKVEVVVKALRFEEKQND